MGDKITIFSFFAGAGFLDLGFEMSGFEIAYVNEIHEPFQDAYKYSRKLLNVPEAQYGYSYDDVAQLTDSQLSNKLSEFMSDARRSANLIGFIGGPPCPDFSVGGKNRGQHGENGKLSGSYVELISKLQPDFFLFENVKGLWKTQKHRNFYEELKRKVQNSGYITTEKLINSIEYSVPQDRDRIILLGFHRDLLGKDIAKIKSIPDYVFPWSQYRSHEKSTIFQLSWPTSDIFQIDSERDCPEEVIADLTVEHWFRKNNIYNHPNSEHYFKPRAGLKKFLSIYEGDDSKKSFKRLHRWRYSPTACYGNNEVHLHPYKPRRISAAEALAIQSLPIEYVLPPDMSLSNMFKTIGNGVPYLMAKSLANLVTDTVNSTNLTHLLELSIDEIQQQGSNCLIYYPRQLEIQL